MYKDKKIIAFDLDNTLSASKTPINQEMSELLAELLRKYDVCIISGGAIEQFMMQVVNRLDITPDMKVRIHLMPASGTKYFIYSQSKNEWIPKYSNPLTDDQKSRTIQALKSSAKELGYWVDNSYGDIIEDRDSQITYSALGQKAPLEEKLKWDPTGDKKRKLRDLTASKIPDLEVRMGGSTSIDVTAVGVNKAYAIKQLMQSTGISLGEILFIGDELKIGGNDYSVKEMGCDTIAVKDCGDTIDVIKRLLANEP
jgi:phosphomannomutase